MEPISMMLMMGIGLGLKAFGSATSMSAASESNKAKQQEIQLQMQVEAQRKRAMEMDARRKQLENFRNVQRAHALALTTATSQGASDGSGLQGAYSQIGAQGGWNAAGINQNLEIGRNIFGINAQISGTKSRQANAAQQMQLGSGISSLGGDLMGAAGPFGRLTSGFDKPNFGFGNG
jgi:hypothetical protein